MRTFPWVIALAWALGGCDDELFGKPGGGEPVATDLEGFCAVQAVFAARCNACHGTSATGGLDLATDPAAALINHPAATDAALTLVVPGDPDASFLWAKVSGTQADGQGGVMPPGGLAADEQEIIRAWIADGADTACDSDAPVTDGYGVHPDGFDDPAVHGLEAKFQDQTCTDCHGADLSGGAGPSCDTCHAAGWREDCTFCHGDADVGQAAPPVNISGADDGADATFIPHLAHVLDTDLHTAFACESCHTTPSNVLSAGHLFVGDDTPGRAETSFIDSLSDAATWDGNGSCSNLYCHGNGQGDNGTISHTATVDGCDDCHAAKSSGENAWKRMSGAHEDHLDEGVDCHECHQATVNSSDNAILDPSLHVNGTKDVVLRSEMTRNANGTCTGTCHGERHSGRNWR